MEGTVTIQISSFILGAGMALTGASLAQHWGGENLPAAIPISILTVFIFAMAKTGEAS
jgi:hypothetical protein